MRYYIITDMEGVSGVVDFDDYGSRSSPYYEKAVRLTTLEVNAAIEGILSTGNHEIIVCDGHGAGAIDIELLHKDAELIFGKNLRLSFEMDDGRYDGLLMVGQHAMQDAAGANLGHTFEHVNIKSLTINGILMGEAGVNALRAGAYDVPTIFLSGDIAACSEIEKIIPGITTCAVKRGISTTSAVCLQPDKAREKIKASVRKAVSSMDRIKPYQLKPPYEAVFDFFNADRLKRYKGKNYCRILPDNKVCIYSDEIKPLLLERLWGL